jgi:opacity protein-like surface antigen
MITRDSKNVFRSSVTKLMLGGAMACLLAAPASATGWNYGGGDAWSGPYVGIGIGGVSQDADVKTSASRNEVTNLDINIESHYSDSSVSAALFPLSQMHNSTGSASDASVLGLVTLGWDQRVGGNWLLGGVFNFDWMNTSAKFSSETWAQGGSSSFDVDLSPGAYKALHYTCKEHSFACGAIVGGVAGATLAHDIRDEHISINGKVEQDYSLQLGGRMGYIWNEVFMTYGGAAWTRTKTKVSATIDIADPVCGSDLLCKEIGSPTQINLNKSNDTDGYKLFVGGEYNVGGNWFLQGQASYSDLDGLNNMLSGQKSQTIIDFETQVHDQQACNSGCGGTNLSVELERQIAETAEISVDKKDYMVHAAVIYKFGGAAAPVAMK